MKEAPAFTYTGVDYAGPLSIKSVNSSGESKVMDMPLYLLHREGDSPGSSPGLDSTVVHMVLQTLLRKKMVSHEDDLRQWDYL